MEWQELHWADFGEAVDDVLHCFGAIVEMDHRFDYWSWYCCGHSRLYSPWPKLLGPGSLGGSGSKLNWSAMPWHDDIRRIFKQVSDCFQVNGKL